MLYKILSMVMYGFWLMLYKILYCKSDWTLYCTLDFQNESVNGGGEVRITPKNLVGPQNRVFPKNWVL